MNSNLEISIRLINESNSNPYSFDPIYLRFNTNLIHLFVLPPQTHVKKPLEGRGVDVCGLVISEVRNFLREILDSLSTPQLYQHKLGVFKNVGWKMQQ